MGPRPRFSLASSAPDSQWLRQSREVKPVRLADRRPAPRPREQSRPARGLCCRRCRQRITSTTAALTVAGRHRHVLFNPAGVIFQVICFRTAPGCLVQGEPTARHSWFAGYLWNYAHCRGCGLHLGWFFQGASQEPFYGLIQDKLVDQGDED